MMGWSIEEDGFGRHHQHEYSSLHAGKKSAVRQALSSPRMGWSLTISRGWVLHPGGRKVLEAVEAALELDDGDLRHSWDVLREFGNMSSPTVLFVLARTLASGASGRHLMAAFGPGFCISFGLLDL